MKLSFKWFTENYYEPDHPRVLPGSPMGGQWLKKPQFLALPPPHVKAPEVVKVSGDIWNQETALRLQREFEAVDDHLGEIADKLVGVNSDFVSPASSWDDLDSHTQEKVESSWKDHNYDSYYENEVDNWRSNGDAEEDAKADVADNTVETDWMKEAIQDYIDKQEEAGLPVPPYDIDTLVMAIDLSFDRGYGRDIEISFNDSRLDKPNSLDYDPKDQLTFPGIEKKNPADALTKEMRDDLIDVVGDAISTEVSRVMDNMDPPDYLADSARESLDMMWDEMSDSEKYDYAKDNDYVEDEDRTEILDKLPSTYDPLCNNGDSKDYKRTQILAKELSISRAAEIIEQRGLIKEPYLLSKVRSYDEALWSGWKDSSTSNEGILLQLATAEELGGRLYTGKISDVAYHKKQADQYYASIGGYAGIKAIVRAKWETSQFLLERANQRIVNVYRGISVYDDDNVKDTSDIETKTGSVYQKLQNYKLHRNGCASTTIDAGVANGWGSGYDRVVLRIAAPRTAVVSLPCYGQNVHHEREVIVAGTAWKSWDAWKGRAPTFQDLPIDDNYKPEPITKPTDDQVAALKRYAASQFTIDYDAIVNQAKGLLAGITNSTRDTMTMHEFMLSTSGKIYGDLSRIIYDSNFEDIRKMKVIDFIKMANDSILFPNFKSITKQLITDKYSDQYIKKILDANNTKKKMDHWIDMAGDTIPPAISSKEAAANLKVNFTPDQLKTIEAMKAAAKNPKIEILTKVSK
jgi:hypothetical protein